jgi:hypothetical protein
MKFSSDPASLTVVPIVSFALLSKFGSGHACFLEIPHRPGLILLGLEISVLSPMAAATNWNATGSSNWLKPFTQRDCWIARRPSIADVDHKAFPVQERGP